MGVVLSLLTAALYGSADFCGGMASARTRTTRVLLGAHAIGLAGIVVVALAIADGFSWRDFGFGAAGGLVGLLGVLLLYRRLAIGPMQVVAPITGVTSAAVPAIWGLVNGETLSRPAWLGIGLALASIVLVTMSDERSSASVTASVIIESLLAGIGFGAFFALLAETSEASAPWPVVGSRVASVTVLVLVAALATQRVRSARSASQLGSQQPSERWDRSLWSLVAWAGLGDTGANATFLFATQRGDLAVVSVLSSLYPLATVLLARIVLGDRMSRPQLVGLGAALTATALIVAG